MSTTTLDTPADAPAPAAAPAPNSAARDTPVASQVAPSQRAP